MNFDTKRVLRNRCGANARLSLGIAALLAVAGLAWGAMPLLLAPVGDEGNASDVTGFGAVSYAYRIGVNEVTRAEYAAFLNAVAATDTHGLYNPNMGITRSGNPGSHMYAATDGSLPVAWVSWYDALRFANWLNNGQPVGAPGAASTETGAYTFSGETSVSARNPGAKVFLPSEDEWYKAAYYQGGNNAWYWTYPTRSDGAPLASLPASSDNAGNFDRAVNAVTPAGAYPASQGYYGTRDQAGNVAEWNEALVDGDRGVRGGSYDDYPLLLQAFYRDSQSPSQENEFVGFRIAATAGTSPSNHAPVALADSYTVDEAATLTVDAPGVLANDTDADGNALTAVQVAGPTHGTLTLNANGAFTYKPTGSYRGADSFSYKPSDGVIYGNTVTVTITIRTLLYVLTVDGGGGDGSYAFGTVVPIQADAAPAGMIFDRWTGSTAFVASVTNASTTLTMQRSATTVTATYKAAPAGPTFDMTVAEWSGWTQYLSVRGKGASGKTVVVSDSLGVKIGSCVIQSDGSWELRVKRSSRQMPSRVRATCDGVTDEMAVKRK